MREDYKYLQDIILKHWSLWLSSKNYVINALKNPFIDEKFKDLVDEDFRIRYPIDVNIFEKYDKGWKNFKRKLNFLVKEGLTYENYLDNKFKGMKISKYIKKLMEKETSYTAKLPLLNALSDLEEINSLYKFDPRGKELVITFNYIDWFMCSTGESWSSCLSMQGGEYYYGLVGLLGDKSRGMIYITDGQKKQFMDFKTDRFLARSWFIISENDNYGIIKWYPAEYFDDGFLTELTGLNFGASNKFFEKECSKYPVDLIYKDSFVDVPYFIYVDVPYFIYVDALYLNDQYYWDLNADTELDVDFVYIEDPVPLDVLNVYNYKINESDKFVECEACGDFIPEDEAHLHGGYYYCETCFEEKFYECDSCHHLVYDDEINYIENLNIHVCDYCYSHHYDVCDECKRIYNKEDLYFVKNKTVCEECMEELETKNTVKLNT